MEHHQFVDCSRISPNDGERGQWPKDTIRVRRGEGGAPEHEHWRIEGIVNDYQQPRDKLAELGFNVDILDFKSTTVVNRVLPASKEAAIEALMKNGGQ